MLAMLDRDPGRAVSRASVGHNPAASVHPARHYTRVQLTKPEGTGQVWAADVVGDGDFVARLSVSMDAGVQLVRLRDGKRVLAEWRSEKGLQRSAGEIADLVDGFYSED